MIENDDLLIRLMNRNDFEVMVKWLNDQRVLEFYEELPSNFDKVEKKYGPRIEGKHYVTPCIVEYNNQPLGYIQYYEIQEDGLKKYEFTSNQNIYGIDQFIGETTLWGKGIGTSMILMMINHLRSKGASKIVLEVKKNNIRAIKSYKKCGFKKTKEITNELNLMEYNMNGVLY